MESLAFIPVFTIYHKKALPYLIALIQHSLIGDYIVGFQTQLLWPITTQQHGIGINIKSQTNIIMEWAIFITSLIIMFKTKDIAAFFQPQKTNLILIIPTSTVLLPTLLSFPLDVPPWLIPPHLILLTIFSASIIIDLTKTLKIFKLKPH